MGKWKNIHSEAPSGNITIESWYNADKNALLFLREEQLGIRVRPAASTAAA